MDGTEPEELAADLAVPADLLSDALAGVLAVMSPDYRIDCTADRCQFACVAICARRHRRGRHQRNRPRL